MFAGLRKWREKRRALVIKNKIIKEAQIALKNGEGFAAPVHMIGDAEAIQLMIERLTDLSGEYVRANVYSGLCFFYPDGADSSPTNFTIVGRKR